MTVFWDVTPCGLVHVWQNCRVYVLPPSSYNNGGSVLFCYTLFHSALFILALFGSILLYSVLFRTILLFSIVFYSIISYFILFYPSLFYSIKYKEILWVDSRYRMVINSASLSSVSVLKSWPGNLLFRLRFVKFLQTNYRIIPPIRPRSLPSESFLSHYLLIVP